MKVFLLKNGESKKLILENVLKADNFVKRFRGLMFQGRQLSAKALWLIPCNAIHTVGLRNSLEVIFLDRDKRVLKVKRNVPPFRIGPVCMRAHSVLEFFSDRLHKYEITEGDQLEVENDQAGSG